MNNATIGKVNDISGFFAKYNELNQAHFQNLFGDNLTASDIETLDYCLSDLYGARFLQSRFNDIYNNQSANECMVRIVAISDRMFFENWLDTKRAIEKALTTDLEKPLASTRNGENSTENKVNAFDSETASDSDESSHSYSETKTYSNGKTATQNAENQIDFSRNNDFLEIIINDVLSVACTSVYDDNYICERTQGGGGGSDPELENRVEQCETDIMNIKKLIPTTATEQNKLATMADVQSGYDDTEIREGIEEINENIHGIYDDLTSYATKAELQAVQNSIPDVSGLATKQELQAVENSIPDVSGLATKQELQAVENTIPDVSNFVTKDFINGLTLYENHSPASVQGTINVTYPTINLLDYKHIDVEYRISTTNDRILVQRFDARSTSQLRINNVVYTDIQYNALRNIRNLSSTGFTISECTKWENKSSSIDNTGMIITKVVAYKY